MEKYIQGKWSEALVEFKSQAIAATNQHDLSVLYCNIAACEYELELHRKCIKNCVTAISCDSKCVNAYLIQGKAYLAINKTQSAIDIWTCGLANTNNLCDCTVVSELQRCLKSATSDEVLAQQPVAAVATNNLIIESKNSTSMNQAKNNIEEFPKSSEYASPRNVTSNINEKVKVNDVIGTESESTITTSTRVQKINESNTISHSKVSSIAEFTNLNEKSDNNSRTKPGDTHPTNSVVNSVNSANTQNNHEIVIRSLHSQLVGEGQNKIAPQLITAARANLSHPSGEFYVDDLLTFGNLLVNSNQPKEALSLFHMLLNHNPNLFLACLGIGTVEAMLSHFDEAIKYFNRAIKLDPTFGDAYKRRGQTRSAKGQYISALQDFNKAIELTNDIDIYNQRGLTLFHMKMYERALTEFRTVKRLYDQKIESGNIQSNESPVDAKLWNNIGMCEAQLGNLDLSYAAYEESMKLDPSYVEAKINYVIILKESSGCMKARTLLHEVIAMNSSMLRQAYQLLFMIYYSLGMIQSAKETVIKMLEYSTTVADRVYGFHQLALCYQCLGEFSHAALNFTKALKLDKNHYCRVQKEVLLYYWNHIGYSTSTFCIDSDIEPLLKEAWSKSLSTSASIQYTNQKVPDSASNRGIKSIHLKTSTGETHVKTHQLLKISSKLGRWIQINSVGFVRNNRQYRMFGLAVIEMASMLREHCDLLVAGKDGLTVKNAASSCARYNSRKDDFHPFGYRDLFDVIVKWRQISEPNDPVWWIDRLSQTSFEEGFGLHTPMVNGELKCIRYYSYFPKGFALMKNLLLTDFYYSAAGTKKELSNELKQHVLNANTLDDLMSIVDEDFYVVCPCRSALNESILLEGTRLTLVKKQPEGYDFSIRSAGLPSRWAAMDAEMKYAFDRVISSLICSTSGSYTNEQLLLVIRESVSLFFYWVNFAPLSRGTAACGYAALLAVIVATGKRIITPIPPKIQLDWEAIFTSDRNVFIENVLMWLRTDDCEFSLENVNFKESVVNLGDMICLLQY